MDDAKRKYLDELRKQIDPDVLAKMADYLGADGDAVEAATQEMPRFSTTAQSIREKHETLSRKRLNQNRPSSAKWLESQNQQNESEQKSLLIILSSTGIWTRIIVSQFSQWGFSASKSFSEFASMMLYVLNGMNEGLVSDFSIAVGIRDVSQFLIGWENLKRGDVGERVKAFLDSIQVFFIVESTEHVNPLLIKYHGPEHIIYLRDDASINAEKVKSVMARITN